MVRRSIVGVVRHRLLVNALVDPAEVGRKLPEGLRPHELPNGGVVVGCCMIEIGDARPAGLPAAVGASIRAAAHRISVEVGSRSDPTRAVYVPARHTDSWPAVALGGRAFPGVHHHASVATDLAPSSISWQVAGRGGDARFDIAAAADRTTAERAMSPVAETVIGTILGISPRRSGALEAVDMQLASHNADVVELTQLDSAFLAGFTTAQPAETLLMTGVEVTWRPATVAG